MTIQHVEKIAAASLAAALLTGIAGWVWLARDHYRALTADARWALREDVQR